MKGALKLNLSLEYRKETPGTHSSLSEILIIENLKNKKVKKAARTADC